MFEFNIASPFCFQIIDRNSDGKLDLQDFALQGTITNVHYQKWTELRDKFDYDGDGMVTMEEVSAWKMVEFLHEKSDLSSTYMHNQFLACRRTIPVSVQAHL